ncbi:GDNF family receptor alpha-4-like [Polymixia lowei]
MIFLGILLNLILSGVSPSSASMFSFRSSPASCMEAHRVCAADPRCEALYRGVELCAADAMVSPLGEQVPAECLDSQDALLARHAALLACKCHRGSRREEQCLRIYWSVRLQPGEDELEVSPYEEMPVDTRMASLVAASSSLPLDGQNQCLKAAQDCGLYEKCGSLRSEYVLACTKRVASSDHCNRQKCHRALRRFLERVPEEYSLGILFCPCTDLLCGERRRKTIVPSCSYQEREGPQPNCLHVQSFCRKDDLCRSRLADFLHNCQPSTLYPSGCLRDAPGLCLRAYAGLIGTIMTPNYISNSSADVSLSCNCEGSGNQWPDCLKLQRMFTHNPCLSNSISSMGSPGPQPAEDASQPPPRPSPQAQEDQQLSDNHLPEHNNIVMESDEEEDLREGDESDEGDQFDVIPLYSERATVSNLGSGTRGGACRAAGPGPSLLVLLLLSAFLSSWG